MTQINHFCIDEGAIERAVERGMDRLDARYMRGEYTGAQYDEEVARLDWWAKDQYRKALQRVINNV